MYFLCPGFSTENACFRGKLSPGTYRTARGKFPGRFCCLKKKIGRNLGGNVSSENWRKRLSGMPRIGGVPVRCGVAAMSARVAAAGTAGAATGTAAAAALAAKMFLCGQNSQHQQHRNDQDYNQICKCHNGNSLSAAARAASFLKRFFSHSARRNQAPWPQSRAPETRPAHRTWKQMVHPWLTQRPPPNVLHRPDWPCRDPDGTAGTGSPPALRRR